MAAIGRSYGTSAASIWRIVQGHGNYGHTTVVVRSRVSAARKLPPPPVDDEELRAAASMVLEAMRGTSIVSVTITEGHVQITKETRIATGYSL